nr:MAG TPA: hypothetical protein [Caudoviricetes sp.]
MNYQRDKEQLYSIFQEPAGIKYFCGFSLFCIGAETPLKYIKN